MIIGGFSDGSGYAFNNAAPSGVKYLSPIYFRELVKFLQNQRIIGQEIGSELEACGLLGESGSTTNNCQGHARQKAFTVWLHVANDCNLTCAYCYIPQLRKAVSNKADAHQVINISTARKVVRELFNYCESVGFETLQIKFAGGEPLLAIEVIEAVCDYGKQRSEETGINISYRILTNGVLISEKAIDLLSRFRFGISISLDGGKIEHDKIRFLVNKNKRNTKNGKIYRQGTWDIISENIDSLISAGIKPYILCTVTTGNHHTLLDVAEFCASKSIGFRYSLIRDKKSSFKISDQEQILGSLINVYTYLGDHLSVTMPLERFARFGEWDLSKMKLKVCGVCSSTLCVDNIGRASACQMSMASKYGVVEEGSLENIILNIRASEENKYLANPKLKEGGCNHCEWRYVCAAGCPEHTRMVFGAIDHSSPWCSVYKGLLPVYVEAIAKQIKRAVTPV